MVAPDSLFVKTMVEPGVALATSWRNEPGPVSARVRGDDQGRRFAGERGQQQSRQQTELNQVAFYFHNLFPVVMPSGDGNGAVAPGYR